MSMPLATDSNLICSDFFVAKGTPGSNFLHGVTVMTVMTVSEPDHNGTSISYHYHSHGLEQRIGG